MTRYVRREGWGARPWKSAELQDPVHIDRAYFHYADQSSPGQDFPHEAAAVAAIQRFHMDTRGWADIGYHAIIGMSGTVYQGRPVQHVGAHTLGHNTGSVGVCFLTNDGFGLAAGAAAVDWIDLAEFLSIHRRVAVFGHREGSATHCPGDTIMGWVERVRAPGGPLHP